MNILFWTHALGDGGAERMVCRLSDELVRRGHNVYVVAISENNPSYEWNEKAHILYAGGDKKSRNARRIHSIGYLRHILKKKRIDAILCFIMNTIPFAVLGTMGAKQRPKIIGVERMNPKVRSRAQKMMIRPFLPFCDGFIFQTRGAKDCFSKSVRIRSTVIGNIVPNVEEHPDIEHIPHSICSAGRLHSEKDFDTELYAMKRIIQRFPDATLHIYGDGPDKKRLEMLRNELGLKDSVIFEGFHKDLADEFQKYDVFLFSSRAEGMPNALVEAMAVGLACVSTDCEFGPGELIRNGENGYLVPIGDSNAMANRVVELFEDDEKRKYLGEKAQEIRLKYSKDRVVDDYIYYFEKVLKR